jgi:hypothetical protein
MAQILNITVNFSDTSLTRSGKTLTANASGATYQWINCKNKALISGQTKQSFNAIPDGTYSVIITKNGCSDTSFCYNVSSVGISENNFSNDISIYPNPSNGKFQLSSGSLQFIKTSNIEIYNMQGRKVYQSEITKSEIDLSNQPKGMYLIKIVNNQLITTKKILIYGQ